MLRSLIQSVLGVVAPLLVIGATPTSAFRKRSLLTLLVCVSGPLAAIAVPAGASALPADGHGNYTQLLCADPSTQEGLGLSGMPEGLSNPAKTILWQVTTSEVNCGSGKITSAKGVPMLVGQTNTYSEGTWSALLYEAPANVTINGGTIYRAEKAEGENAGFMGIIQQGGNYESLYSLPRNCCDQGDWFSGNVAARGSFVTPFSSGNVVNLTISPDERHWDINATCDPNGNNGGTCTLKTDQWEYRIFGGEMSLHASHDPQATNISGTLATESPLHGTDSLTFSATDEGPGLAYVKVLIDGNIVQSQIIDTNDGHCVPVAGHGAYVWAYQVPCRTSVGGRTYSLDTTRLSNGQRHIQVILEDAAGNQAEVLNRTVAIENASPESLGTLPGSGGSSGNVAGGSGLTSPVPVLVAPLRVPNGAPATEAATVRLGVTRKLRRSYAHSGVVLRGRLLSSSGVAVGGAHLDVLQVVSGTHKSVLVGHVGTDVNGTFAARVGRGPSRELIVAYRAFSTDPTYAAQVQVREIVGAGVQLSVRPTRTARKGTIKLRGQVAGPIPRGGIIVALLVHYRGRWVPFRNPQTDRRGHFHTTYQFNGARGRFPFKALVFGGQSRFPYVRGESRTINVRTY